RPAHRWAEELLRWWPALDAGPISTLPGRVRSLEAWAIESADIVLCASRRNRSFAERLAPATPAVVVDGAGSRPPYSDRAAGIRATGVLPAGPRFGSIQPGAGADLLAPLRAFHDALRPLAPQLADELRIDRSLASLGRWSDSAVAHGAALPEAPPRLALIPPPLVVSLGDLAATPFVTWRGGAAGLDLGELEGLLVADSQADLARLARNLYEKRSVWEHVHATLAGMAAEGAARSEESLWGALAHCGFGPPVAGPLRRTSVAR
ncbi:MAG TPA: hypothetical protein VKW77_02165, partial [Acidimicrobiales bacterium]|nr:hypothetical protein [Acidimicrobiales bacterium]